MGMMCSSPSTPTPARRCLRAEQELPDACRTGQSKSARPHSCGSHDASHIGAEKGAKSVETAVNTVLQNGYRTGDLFSKTDDPKKLLGTSAMEKRSCLL